MPSEPTEENFMTMDAPQEMPPEEMAMQEMPPEEMAMQEMPTEEEAIV